jgi:hypothetical protein
MILPKDVLDDVKWYEADPLYDGERSRVVLHWKKKFLGIFNRKSIIYIALGTVHEDRVGPVPTYWKLIEQLDTHFQRKPAGVLKLVK